jgi:YbbR domain-containing protein
MSAEETPRWAWLTANRGAKLIALLLAVITWYAIQPSISFETVITGVPVQVTVDPGWAVLDRSLGSVDVHFRGSREAIRFLAQEELAVLVDLRNREYGQSLTVPLELDAVRAPGGVRPTYIRPAEVTITMDQEVDRLVPVRAHIQGEPPAGYEVEEIVVNPQQVTVSGPRQRLQAIEAIRTTPIEMEGRLQSFTLRVPLVAPSQTWSPVMDPERVEVLVTLQEQSSEITLTNVPVRVLKSASDVDRALTLEPPVVDLFLIGRSAVLSDVSNQLSTAYIDLSQLVTTGTLAQTAPVRVHVPPGVRLDRVEPARVRVLEAGDDLDE